MNYQTQVVTETLRACRKENDALKATKAALLAALIGVAVIDHNDDHSDICWCPPGNKLGNRYGKHAKACVAARAAIEAAKKEETP